MCAKTVKIKKRSTNVGIFKNVKCEESGKCFSSHQVLFRHKVAQHGLETPDKTVLLKKNALCYIYHSPGTVYLQ